MSKESIWFRDDWDLAALNALSDNTMDSNLGIEYTEMGPDFLRGTMPADHRTFQPFGRIHGGANVALAESLGSLGANMVVDMDKYYCVGQEINANHLRGVMKGKVTGTARPVYIGRTSQVWEIRIEDDRGRLSCISRITMAAIRK
jgi:1,4-dihydroxy-2-naphthoyl-CoA hydrolase